jgi:XRE family transcriptional regulator, regulator of sulfur utilization
MASAAEGERPALAGGAAEVGPRVTALRVDRGGSLSELARRASLGKATLSGLESGTRNPTLDTLHSVAAALGVPLTAIVGAPAGGMPAMVRGTAVEITLLRVFDDGPVTYELYRMRVPAGAAQQSPPHHEGVTEHATVFAGVLAAGPVGRPLTAAAGEHIEWAADVPHGYAAVGATDVLASLLIRYPRPAAKPAGPGPGTASTLVR